MRRARGAPLCGDTRATDRGGLLTLIHRNKVPTPASMRVSGWFAGSADLVDYLVRTGLLMPLGQGRADAKSTR